MWVCVCVERNGLWLSGSRIAKLKLIAFVWCVYVARGFFKYNNHYLIFLFILVGAKFVQCQTISKYAQPIKSVACKFEKIYAMGKHRAYMRNSFLKGHT